jgi:hypothetical protein
MAQAGKFHRLLLMRHSKAAVAAGKYELGGTGCDVAGRRRRAPARIGVQAMFVY